MLTTTRPLFIASTLAQEPDDPPWADHAGLLCLSSSAACDLAPGNARQRASSGRTFFDQRHYDLERVGRYKLNQKLELYEHVPIANRTITKWDIVRLVKRMIAINNGIEAADDIDHLGNRRAKTVGELIQNKLRIGLRRMERVIKERMSIRDQDQLSPITLINIRPVVAALREFFGQPAPIHGSDEPAGRAAPQRTLSALGPGACAENGLARCATAPLALRTYLPIETPKVLTLV
jgi:DNA-directed RNA polymerase subunit beta